MSISRFIQQFADAVEGSNASAIDTETKFRLLEEWDSLAALSVLAMIDAEYDVQISGIELQNCQSLRELFALVETKVLP